MDSGSTSQQHEGVSSNHGVLDIQAKKLALSRVNNTQIHYNLSPAEYTDWYQKEYVIAMAELKAEWDDNGHKSSFPSSVTTPIYNDNNNASTNNPPTVSKTVMSMRAMVETDEDRSLRDQMGSMQIQQKIQEAEQKLRDRQNTEPGEDRDTRRQTTFELYVRNVDTCRKMLKEYDTMWQEDPLLLNRLQAELTMLGEDIKGSLNNCRMATMRNKASAYRSLKESPRSQSVPTPNALRPRPASARGMHTIPEHKSEEKHRDTNMSDIVESRPTLSTTGTEMLMQTLTEIEGQRGDTGSLSGKKRAKPDSGKTEASYAQMEAVIADTELDKVKLMFQAAVRRGPTGIGLQLLQDLVSMDSTSGIPEAMLSMAINKLIESKESMTDGLFLYCIGYIVHIRRVMYSTDSMDVLDRVSDIRRLESRAIEWYRICRHFKSYNLLHQASFCNMFLWKHLADSRDQETAPDNIHEHILVKGLVLARQVSPMQFDSKWKTTKIVITLTDKHMDDMTDVPH